MTSNSSFIIFENEIIGIGIDLIISLCRNFISYLQRIFINYYHDIIKNLEYADDI